MLDQNALFWSKGLLVQAFGNVELSPMFYCFDKECIIKQFSYLLLNNYATMTLIVDQICLNV